MAVDQESSLNFRLEPAGVSTSIEVTATAPLLDTDSATLGSEISSEYVQELPLINRGYFGLTFLAAGVTEYQGRACRITIPLEPTSLPTGSATLPPRCGWTAP